MSKPLLHYYNISSEVVAFSTTRHGGKSNGTFGTLNINAYRGDDPIAVEANLEAVAKEINVPKERIIRQHQVHGTDSRMIAEEFFLLPTEVKKQILEGSDALLTDVQGVCIGVHTADCVPVLLYDTVHHAAAAIHAGWRGTVKHIVRKTIYSMMNVYNTAPKDLKAVIGPCISLKNFEVGQEVYNQFAEANFDMDKVSKFYEKWHINLPLANEYELLSLGVKPNNIFQSGICTYDNYEDYFSARRIKENFGTIYTGIILKK